MITKSTPKQSKQINSLIRKRCCNYVDGNCLLLDEGEEHRCVQLISQKRYFLLLFQKRWHGQRTGKDDFIPFRDMMNDNTA